MKKKEPKHDQTSMHPHGSVSSVAEQLKKPATELISKNNTNKWAPNDELWNG